MRVYILCTLLCALSCLRVSVWDCSRVFFPSYCSGLKMNSLEGTMTTLWDENMVCICMEASAALARAKARATTYRSTQHIPNWCRQTAPGQSQDTRIGSKTKMIQIKCAKRRCLCCCCLFLCTRGGRFICFVRLSLAWCFYVLLPMTDDD